MKFTAVTFGTEGDTRPIAMLCRALMDAGHDVTLLADGSTLGSARALGVPHTAMAGDIRRLLDPEGGITSAASGKTDIGASAKALARIANDNAVPWMRQTLDVAQSSDAIIAAGLAAFVGVSVAEKLDIPSIGAGMFPLTPTREFPSAFLPPGRIPRWLNRLSQVLITEMLWRAFRKSINEARVTVCGLPPRRKSWTDHPILYGISPSLLPRPADWPSQAYLCGQWIRRIESWHAPQPLLDFLAAGEAPLYVGFGSMFGFDQQALLEAVVAAIGGRRALFYPGWGGTRGLRLPANFHVLGDTPHDWLFPQTSLVIHHGGSGTTHSAARAGVPSIVLPFAGDQFFWAEQLRLRGVAPPTITGRHFSADSLARAIEATSTPAMRANAADLGEKMRREDGLTVGVELLQRIAATSATTATTAVIS